MSEETSHLKDEITRLNKIINVLLEQNDTIKAGYSRLRKQFEQNNTNDRQLLQHMGVINAPEHETLQHTGVTKAGNPETLQQMGVTKTNYPDTQQHMGVINALYPETQQQTGVTNAPEPEALQQLPLPNILPSETLQQPAPEQTVLSLPEKLTPSPQLFSSIASQLEQAGFTRVKQNTRQTAAQLLVHFYNGGIANYASLQQLTGYSQGGLGKLLIALRKRGFIQRAGYGNYVVTEKTKIILAKV